MSLRTANLDGGIGADLLQGGEGNDTLNGGVSADTVEPQPPATAATASNRSVKASLSMSTVAIRVRR